MVKSMTGFGRAQKMVGGRDIPVEIKSVNHRYFEFSSRISRAYGFEEKMKSYTQGSSPGQGGCGSFHPDHRGLWAARWRSTASWPNPTSHLRGAGEETGLTDDLSL